MAGSLTLGVTEFRTRCLDILDRINRRELERVIITKRGAAVGVLVSPPVKTEAVEALHGFLRGSVVIPPDVDLTAPATEDRFAAEERKIHR
jgi:antitoxin (DNA-binding transcriptional repressor) of toxin-antitoxin stability system